jgi:hypothetical protein
MAASYGYVDIKCHACGEMFEIQRGSLLRLCKRPECLAARRGIGLGRARELSQKSATAKLKFEGLLNDPDVRDFQPEAIEVIELAARIEVPTPGDLARGIKAVAKARGHLPLREALITLSAFTLRRAASLPRTKAILGYADTPDARRKRAARERERVAA